LAELFGRLGVELRECAEPTRWPPMMASMRPKPCRAARTTDSGLPPTPSHTGNGSRPSGVAPSRVGVRRTIRARDSCLSAVGGRTGGPSRRCSGDATRAVELVVPGQQGPRAPNTLGETGRRRGVDAAWSLTAYQGYSLGWERACVWHDRPMASHQHRPHESGRASRAPPVGGSGLSRRAVPPAEVSLTGDDPDALAAGPTVPVLCRDRPQYIGNV